jgi:Trypsin-like peptidase domain/NACHT domain
MATVDAVQSSSTIEDLFRRCVVRIRGRGTGFFVLPNCVLTCSHLFDRDNATSVDVMWQNRSGVGHVIKCLRTKSSPAGADLAWVEIDWKGETAAEHPCVMLSNDVKRDDTFVAFGHPNTGKFEINGDSVTFSYSGPSPDQNQISYIKIRGDRTKDGFSGSPILNLRTRKVCGVLAMSLNLDAAEGGRMLPIDYALAGFANLAELSKLHHHTWKGWTDLLPGVQLWKQVEANCKRNVETARTSAQNKASDDLYVAREMEKKVDSFLEPPDLRSPESKGSAMVIIGQSGMGKTTLVNRLLAKYSVAGHLCAMFESREFRATGEVESRILNELAPRRFADIHQLFAQIGPQCDEEQKSLLIFIDAANEFNQANQANSNADRPVGFVVKLDEIISAARDYPRIKFLITSRPEIWRKALDSARNQFENSKSSYYREGGEEIAHRLPRFSGSEVREAYDNYKKRWNVATEFEQLSELAKYLLRDPFFLSLTTEVYGQLGLAVPPDLNTGEVFAQYKMTLGKDDEEFGDDRDLMEDILNEMFSRDNAEVVETTVITRGKKLRESNKTLYDDLSSTSPRWSRLKERSVLRELPSRDKDGNEIFLINFTYDRFAEFLLSHKLKDKILNEAEASPKLNFVNVATRVVSGNLESSQQTTVVWGALQQTLLLLQKQESCDYAKLLQQIAELDARGLSLVVSVLARTATGGGIEVLETLLKNLEGGKKPMKGSTNQFPIIDAVYRVLRNDEYRAWLADKKKTESAVVQRHFDVLFGYFRWGFCHLDGTVSATAIQYLFFLWRGKGSLEDATAVTDEIVAVVRPFSIFEVLRKTDQVRVIPNIAGLMVLSLAELQEDERSKLALAAATQMIRNLELRSSAVFRLLSPLKSIICRYALSIMGRLQNPIKLKALETSFANFGPTLRDFEEAMGFIRPGFDLERSKARVRELSHSGSSFVLQMLCFALSICFEREMSADGADKSLGIMKDLFHEKGAPATTRYCISLALYHINYFGDKATRHSMQVMGDMAEVILSEHKGVFVLDDEVLNFNIVGTYGRALYKNGHLLSTSEKSITQRAFQYAIDAIEQAKQIQDSGYYVYVCENIGLLGVLIEPSQVFDVISHILRDLSVIVREGVAALPMPFTVDECAKAKHTVLQSLANIRVLYRQEVDKYLLDDLESTDLYAEVANKLEAKFDIATFYSWAFEQLFFRVMTKYYAEMGKDMVTALIDGGRSGSPKAALEIVVERVIERVNEIAV